MTAVLARLIHIFSAPFGGRFNSAWQGGPDPSTMLIRSWRSRRSTGEQKLALPETWGMLHPAPDPAIRKKILVDNPARLYEF
jgi:hypothetical protein